MLEVIFLHVAETHYRAEYCSRRNCYTLSPIVSLPYLTRSLLPPTLLPPLPSTPSISCLLTPCFSLSRVFHVHHLLLRCLPNTSCLIQSPYSSSLLSPTRSFLPLPPTISSVLVVLFLIFLPLTTVYLLSASVCSVPSF